VDRKPVTIPRAPITIRIIAKNFNLLGNVYIS
jgi:hypothetical protein